MKRSSLGASCSHGVLGAITDLQIIHNTIHRSQTFLWIFHTIFSYKFAFLAKKPQISWVQNWLCRMLFGCTRSIEPAAGENF